MADEGSKWVNPTHPTHGKITPTQCAAALMRAEHALLMVRVSLGQQAQKPHFGDDLPRDLARALADCGDAITALRALLATGDV